MFSRAKKSFYQCAIGCWLFMFLSACGGSGTDQPAAATSCEPAYVTGSVGGAVSAAAALLSGDAVQSLSRTIAPAAAGPEVIVQMQNRLSCADLAARYDGLIFKREMRGAFCLFESGLSGEDLSALKSDPDVKSFELNEKLGRLYTADPYASIDWAMQQTGAPALLESDLQPIGDVVIAVLDSGLRYHEDLPAAGSPLWVRGYDFVSDLAAAGDGDGPDGDPTDVGTEPFSHGVGVTGIIAAIRGNGRGSFGAAAGVKIMPVRVIGTDGGSVSDTVEGLYYAAGLPNRSGTLPPVKADIINISLGTGSFSAYLQAAVAEVRANGVIIVASTGNDGGDGVDYPAAFAEVIGVGAIDINRDRAPYSNYGAGITLVAGAGDLEAGSSWNDGKFVLLGSADYGLADGTSVAAPLISASLGWVKAACPFLTPLDVDELIAGTHPDTSVVVTIDEGTDGYDRFYGYGRLSTSAGVEAAEAVCNAAYTPPEPYLSTTALALSAQP